MPSSSPVLHFSTSILLATTVLSVLTWPVPAVQAYYCDDNLCSPADQFCCGENICCSYVNNTVWRLVCVLISVIVFGIFLWATVQLLLALVAIYYGHNNDAHLQDVEHQPRNSFVADIENDVSLVCFVKRILNAFRHKKTPTRPYLYSPRTSKQSAASSTASLMAYKEEHEDKPFH